MNKLQIEVKKKIPKEWSFEKIDQICFFQEGPGLLREQFGNSEEDIPFLNIRCIKENGTIDRSAAQKLKLSEVELKYKHFLLAEGDIVVSTSGTIGRLAKVHKYQLPLLLNTSIIRFRPLDENVIHPEFLVHLLKSNFFYDQIVFESQGSAQVNVGPTHIKKCYFQFPRNLEEQKKIAEILSAMDRVAELATDEIQKIKDLKKGLMRDLLSNGVGHSKFKKSSLGKIPCDWAITSLKDLGKWKGGGTPSKSNKDFWDNGTIAWVSPKDLKGDYILGSEDKITVKAVSGSSAQLLPKNAIVFVARSGILKHSVPIALSKIEFTVNQDMKVLIPNERFDVGFVFLALKAMEDKIRLNAVKAGTIVESLDTELLHKIPFPMPEIKEQIKIRDMIMAVANTLELKEVKLNSLMNLKKALMNDLLSGKVRVKF